MSDLNFTWAEYQRLGKYPAKVPGLISHIHTKTKTIRRRLPACRDWPQGREVTDIGPQILPVQITSDGVRCVRFDSKEDFQALCASNNGLEWHDLNTDLRLQIAAESSNRAGPISR